MRSILLCSSFGLLVLTGCDVTTSPNVAELHQENRTTSASKSEEGATAVDNTAINQRDRDSDARTPFDQSEDPADVQITANIRQRVVDLPGMSLNGQNVKIITADGRVTLRGPVNSVDERAAIEKIANDVAGADKVENQLEVTAK